MTPDPIKHPTLCSLQAVLTERQWSDLFANRLAKRSAAQMLVKHRGGHLSAGALNRLADTIAVEMRAFRPIEPRKTGDKLLI